MLRAIANKIGPRKSRKVVDVSIKHERPQTSNSALAESKPSLEKRYGHTAITKGSKIIIFGGKNQIQVLNDVLMLDFETIEPNYQFQQVTCQGLSPPPTFLHSAVFDAEQNNMVIFGGWSSTLSKEVFTLNLDSWMWDQIIPIGAPPSPRRDHSAVVVTEVTPHRMFVWGGQTGEGRSDELFALDLITNEWTQLETYGSKPKPRTRHTAVADHKSMIVFGGFYLNDTELYRLDLETYTWTPISCTGICPAARWWHSAVVYGRFMLIYAGQYLDGRSNSFYVLHLDALKWNKLKTKQVRQKRDMHTCSMYKGNVYVVGGRGQSDFPVGEIFSCSIADMDIFRDKSTPQDRLKRMATPLARKVTFRSIPPHHEAGQNHYDDTQRDNMDMEIQEAEEITDDSEDDLTPREGEDTPYRRNDHKMSYSHSSSYIGSDSDYQRDSDGDGDAYDSEDNEYYVSNYNDYNNNNNHNHNNNARKKSSDKRRVSLRRSAIRKRRSVRRKSLILSPDFDVDDDNLIDDTQSETALQSMSSTPTGQQEYPHRHRLSQRRTSLCNTEHRPTLKSDTQLHSNDSQPDPVRSSHEISEEYPQSAPCISPMVVNEASDSDDQHQQKP